MTTPSEQDPPPPAVEVFWRPGCIFCTMLRRDLERRGITATWRNIWDDEAARDIVRAANRGNETVPTVRVGTTTLTNPSADRIARLLGHQAPIQARPGRLADRVAELFRVRPVTAHGARPHTRD